VIAAPCPGAAIWNNEQGFDFGREAAAESSSTRPFPARLCWSAPPSEIIATPVLGGLHHDHSAAA
jgi:hypothetical protein